MNCIYLDTAPWLSDLQQVADMARSQYAELKGVCQHLKQQNGALKGLVRQLVYRDDSTVCDLGTTTTTTTTVLWPFVRDYPGESVPKGQTILDFAEADMMGWQWHQLNHMQAICTSFQKTTMPAPHHSDFYGPHVLPDTQPTASKHWTCSEYPRTVLSGRDTALHRQRRHNTPVIVASRRRCELTT